MANTFVGVITDTLQTLGLGTIAVNIFEGRLPPNPDSCIATFDTGGLGPDRYQTGSVKQPRCQLIIRDKSYGVARDKAYTVYNYFQISNRTIGGVPFVTIYPVDEPAFMRRDENDRVEFTLNLQGVH